MSVALALLPSCTPGCGISSAQQAMMTATMTQQQQLVIEAAPAASAFSHRLDL
jgi:hypothetical protein